MQVDVYTPLKDIVLYTASNVDKGRKKYRAQRVRENITQLSPAINSGDWEFRFVEIHGHSLHEIDDHKFLNDQKYAAECLKFAATMQLPKDNARPNFVRPADVFNSARKPLSEWEKSLNRKATSLFKQLNINRKAFCAICEQFEGDKAMRTASHILRQDPDFEPQYCNRSRWGDKAKLGTITNWLGDRTTLSGTERDLFMQKVGTGTSPFQRERIFEDDEGKFVYELILLVQHAFDTVEYLRNTLHCYEIIDISHVGHVMHDNGRIPDSLSGFQENVNRFSYTLLLPLFFTKELYVYRTRMLAQCRSELIEYRALQSQELSGDVRKDSRRMRSKDGSTSKKIREASEKVCLADLVGGETHNMIRTYGTFHEFQRENVCGMPDSSVTFHLCSKKVNHKVGHILKNVGSRLRRTQLDKKLKGASDDIMLAGGDLLVTHALPKTVVVYTNDPIWGFDIIGAVEQPIMGYLQCIRHRLLAYLALIHMLSVNDDEEMQMQELVLEHCYSKDNEKLKDLVMDFLKRKIIDRKNTEGSNQGITTSEVESAARWTCPNAVEKAIVEREMIHYLITGKTKLVPTIAMEENDGCYYKLLYRNCTHGNGKLLINMSIPLAGLLASRQSYYSQLHTKDDRVLLVSQTDGSTVDLQDASGEASVLHLWAGDESDRSSEMETEMGKFVVRGDFSVV